MRTLPIVAVALSVAAPVAAQEIIRNPTAIYFQCSEDHALHTGHEVDLVDETGKVVQTISFGTAAPDANGEVMFRINVQPVAFGRYTGRVRAVAGTLRSDVSETSNVWERAPGQPGKPRVAIAAN